MDDGHDVTAGASSLVPGVGPSSPTVRLRNQLTLGERVAVSAIAGVLRRPDLQHILTSTPQTKVRFVRLKETQFGLRFLTLPPVTEDFVDDCWVF